MRAANLVNEIIIIMVTVLASEGNVGICISLIFGGRENVVDEFNHGAMFVGNLAKGVFKGLEVNCLKNSGCPKVAAAEIREVAGL